jgi:hypothetical protein
MIRHPPKFREALEVVVRYRVDFVVVGGVAAVLGGAPISTFDLDIVHDRCQENVVRLMLALTDLEAHYRDFSGRVLRRELHALEGGGHHLLLTRCGPLDVLGSIGKGRGYRDLVGDSITHTVGELDFSVLSLEALIREKVESGRDKDRAVLPILRRTLEESRK